MMQIDMETARTEVSPPRRALLELIRTAALAEWDRTECYCQLIKQSDDEVVDETFPALARVYEDQEDAARDLRVVLLGRAS
jgi:hypothetical protein